MIDDVDDEREKERKEEIDDECKEVVLGGPPRVGNDTRTYEKERV